MRRPGPARRARGPSRVAHEDQPARRPRVALLSLGCRVGRADVEALADRLSPRFELCRAGEAADVVVVGTCTVTGDADASARQAIRGAARLNPAARIVATGCYAARAPQDLSALPGVVAVVGARSQEAVAGLVAGLAGGEPVAGTLAEAARSAPAWAPPAPGAGRRARPAVKVQDGCDAGCAYCVVPLARGPSRSLPLEEAVARLLAAGARHAEVVLTGVHLGAYGRDLTPPSSLAELVATAVARGLTARLRLSSVEPLELPLELLAGPATARALCEHLHLPLQSGSARLLEAMGRPYRPEDYRRVVERAAALRPGACLGADVMAGFPGETDEDHQATLALCRALPLAYLHVFPYSARPGTAAARLPGQVDPAVARARARELRDLSAARWAAYLSAQVGRVLEAVVERVEGGVARGTARNRVRVRWPAGPEARGARCAVRVEAVAGAGCRGVLVGGPATARRP